MKVEHLAAVATRAEQVVRALEELNSRGIDIDALPELRELMCVNVQEMAANLDAISRR